MTNYVSQKLNISHEEAHDLRDQYWKVYGATLKGLMENHGVNPKEFLNAKEDDKLFKKLKDKTLEFRYVKLTIVFDGATTGAKQNTQIEIVQKVLELESVGMARKEAISKVAADLDLAKRDVFDAMVAAKNPD